MRKLWCIPLALITACTAPTTQRPDVTREELRAEQDAQSAAVKAAQNGTFNDQKTYSQAELEQLATRLGGIAKRVEQASKAVCLDLKKTKCDFRVLLDPQEKGLNAHADGQNVVVYPAMVDFATNDNQLAFVIAHEFGHSIMNHVASEQNNERLGGLLGTIIDVAADTQGIKTGGMGGKIGAQQALLRYSPAFESEADYVGLYILARAGYKIEDAPDFWRQMSIQVPDAIFATSTHPNNANRALAMQKTVAEIRAKQAAHQPLLPNIAPKK